MRSRVRPQTINHVDGRNDGLNYNHYTDYMRKKHLHVITLVQCNSVSEAEHLISKRKGAFMKSVANNGPVYAFNSTIARYDDGTTAEVDLNKHWELVSNIWDKNKSHAQLITSWKNGMIYELGYTRACSVNCNRAFQTFSDFESIAVLLDNKTGEFSRVLDSDIIEIINSGRVLVEMSMLIETYYTKHDVYNNRELLKKRFGGVDTIVKKD